VKNPLYALLISPDKNARRAILMGKKKITIREEHRDYRAGQAVMICCHLEPWAVMADITEVRHTELGKILEQEHRDDGYENRNELLSDLRIFYPDIDWKSPVTVIRWNNVRGKLKDEYDKSLFNPNMQNAIDDPYYGDA
jgi:hypothetical protein